MASSVEIPPRGTSLDAKNIDEDFDRHGVSVKVDGLPKPIEPYDEQFEKKGTKVSLKAEDEAPKAPEAYDEQFEKKGTKVTVKAEDQKGLPGMDYEEQFERKGTKVTLPKEEKRMRRPGSVYSTSFRFSIDSTFKDRKWKVKTCPGNHELKRYRTPYEGYECSSCKTPYPARTVLRGCRTCDYDICAMCDERHHEEVFKSLDEDQTGVVTMASVRRNSVKLGLTEAQAEDVFKKLDTEDKGEINYESFKQGYIALDEKPKGCFPRLCSSS